MNYLLVDLTLTQYVSLSLIIVVLCFLGALTSKPTKPTIKQRILKLQKKGRKIRIEQQKIELNYDCGYHALMNISPDYARLDAEMDILMSELKPLMDKDGGY